MDPDGLAMTFHAHDAHEVSNFAPFNKTKTNTSVTPTRISADSSHWQRVLQTINRKPALVTQKVFFETLQRRPPVPVVLQMLRVAPQVATLPSSGPTALQVALQSGASLGVVRTLLEACPFALCVARSFDAIDPLSYASKSQKCRCGEEYQTLSDSRSDYNSHCRDSSP